MAFNQYNLERVHNQQRGGFDLFVYSTTDTIAEVTASGYFNVTEFGYKSPGSNPKIIKCSCADGDYEVKWDVASGVVLSISSSEENPKLNMIQRASIDSLRSSGQSIKSFGDAEYFSQNWSDLSNWAATSPVGVQVSGNLLYSIGANSGKNGINHGIGLGVSGSFRMICKLYGKNGGSSSSGGVIIGFSQASTNGVPSLAGVDVFGLYLRGGGRPQKVVDNVFTDLASDAADYERDDDYTITLTLDNTYISVVAVSDVDGTEIMMRHLRGSIPINNIHIFNSDADELTGVSVGAIYSADRIRSFGTNEQDGSIQWSGDGTNNFKLYLPDNYDSRTAIKLCIGFHGNGSDENHWSTNSNGKGVKDGIVSAGYAFLGCTYAANKQTWGAQESLDAYYAAYLWVKSFYPIDSVVFYGNSMGGIESLLSIAEQKIPNVLAWVGTNPTTDLADNYANATFTNIINNAYSIDGGNPYATATQGHDPILKSPLSYYGVPMLFIAADDDTVVSPVNNTDAMIDKLSGFNETSKIAIPSGGHSANFVAYISNIVDWYNNYSYTE